MIESWLRPLSAAFIENLNLSPNCIHDGLAINTDNDFSDLGEYKVVLVGVEEEAANKIRSAFYRLSDHFKDLAIFDLGNLRKNDEQFLTGLLQELLEGGLIPVLFGTQPTYLCSQFYASKTSQNTVNGVNISEDVAYGLDNGDLLLNKLLRKDSGLFHLSQLAFQRHYVDLAVLKHLSKLHVNLLSLGAVGFAVSHFSSCRQQLKVNFRALTTEQNPSIITIIKEISAVKVI